MESVRRNAVGLVLLAVAVQRSLANTTLCLDHLTCYYDQYLDHSNYTTYHSYHPKRTAENCAILCLQKDPDTDVVLAKLEGASELLVCGCGNLGALRNHSGTATDYHNCHLCPDSDSQKCGSESTSSVYKISHGAEYCDRISLTIPGEISTVITATPYTTTTGQDAPELLRFPATRRISDTFSTTQDSIISLPWLPSVSYLGCYDENGINETYVVTMVVEADNEDLLTACAGNCSLAHPETDVFLLKLLNERKVYCGCGTSAALPSFSGYEGTCDLSCGGGEEGMPCGGWVAVSAYFRSGALTCLTSCWLTLACLLLLHTISR